MRPLDMREEENAPKVMPAICITDISDEILEGILRLYDKVVFGQPMPDEGGIALLGIRNSIEQGDENIALGSNFPGSRSRLLLNPRVGSSGGGDRVIVFGFDANMGRDHPDYAEGKRMAVRFREETFKYLKEKGMLYTAPDK